MKEFLKNFKEDPGAYLSLIIMAALIVGAIIVLLTSSAANWRYLYCQASPAHAIECTAKGWW